MTHKEMTKHIRRRLAVAGLKARCKMIEDCGHKMIYIDTPTYEAIFSEEDQSTIVDIISANRLTYIRGLPVTKNGTLTHGGHFEFIA